MPITPTYPGVYVEELSSGVRTIAGVSTSVTAFLGAAKRGPIDAATPCRSWADYERRFGGLDVDSELSYSVRQFFNNGGSEAIIIRVAANTSFAEKMLVYGLGGGKDALKITAKDAGSAGNAIEIRVANAGNPNNFTIRAILNDPANPVEEKFESLSMSSRSARYAVSVINAQSDLIRASRPAITFDQAATSVSGEIKAAQLNQIDTNHNSFRLSLNGGEPITVTIAGPVATIGDLASKIFNDAKAKGSGPAYGADFKVDALTTPDRIKITSGEKGEFASVRILPAPSKDMSSILKLGADNGGIDTDGVAAFRPMVTPTRASITSQSFVLGDLAAIPTTNKTNFKLTLDGLQKDIELGNASVTGGGTTIGEKLTALANHITSKVIAFPGEAFTKFTASVDGDKLVFSDGTAGATSAIKVNSGANDVLALLKFNDNDSGAGTTTRLENGHDDPPGTSATAFIGSRLLRTGLYALESVDIFNLLCVPGITDFAIISEALAYCGERRAFLIMDPPPNLRPDAMNTAVQNVPKDKNGAIYYPLLGVPDPLQNSIMRMVPPSGTIAGVMARTDATRGVWKAPAGIDAFLGGVQALEYTLTDAENGALNPRAVNCLRVFPNYGPVSWGARTLFGDDDRGDEWKYIPVRRLALYIEESLFRGTKWAVFEPNDEPLWAELRMNVGSFMHDLFRQGAFAGSSPRDAYLVKCDKDTTTQSDVNRGKVNVLVGFAPLKPAEFVFINIQQLAGQLSA